MSSCLSLSLEHDVNPSVLIQMLISGWHLTCPLYRIHMLLSVLSSTALACLSAWADPCFLRSLALSESSSRSRT